MAQPSPASKARPLSPHLQIWRWTWAMRVSILHRITGNGLAFFGLGTLLCWLAALAGGPASYQLFCDWFAADFGQLLWSGAGLVPSVIKVALRLLLVGLSWAFFSHFCSGIRHFILDIGAGYELKGNRAWAILTPVFGILLTIAFWAVLLLR